MSGPMTISDYYKAINRLGLRPTNVRTVYMGPDEMPYNVPDPTSLPDTVRSSIIEHLREMLDR